MTATADRHDPQPLPPWLVRWWFVVSVIAVAAVLLGVFGVYTNGRQDAADAAENKARDQQNSALLKCFDEFASDLSGGLPPVRTATAASNNALSEALAQLQLGLVKVGGGTFTDADLKRIITEFDEYQKASRHLTQVRKDNPYPPPPSTFCSNH